MFAIRKLYVTISALKIANSKVDANLRLMILHILLLSIFVVFSSFPNIFRYNQDSDSKLQIITEI